jgi:hypothetical protein
MAAKMGWTPTAVYSAMKAIDDVHVNPGTAAEFCSAESTETCSMADGTDCVFTAGDDSTCPCDYTYPTTCALTAGSGGTAGTCSSTGPGPQRTYVPAPDRNANSGDAGWKGDSLQIMFINEARDGGIILYNYGLHGEGQGAETHRTSGARASTTASAPRPPCSATRTRRPRTTR